MERIDLGEVTLQVEMRGAGPVLLLVHGFPLDHQMWRHQLDELSSDFRVLAPDLRGFGQSDHTPGIVTMQTYADDLAKLLDKLEVREPVTLCGLSMGGYIAWQFVERHRARLAKLVLCDTRAIADTPQGAQGRLETAQKVLKEGPQALVDGMIPKLFAPATIQSQPDLIAATRTIMLESSPEGIAAALRGMAERPDVTARLPTYDVPALVICGAQDAIVNVTEMRSIAEQLPHGRFVEVTDAGHMAPLEKPNEVNAALREFLQG
jgi:pimeloyl-ACP methyl ester carboxylesterase